VPFKRAVYDQVIAPSGPIWPEPMLSYQHAYHAGNLADVHKHALLAWMLDYLTRKPKSRSATSRPTPGAASTT
jgi:hypothetical protein